MDLQSNGKKRRLRKSETVVTDINSAEDVNNSEDIHSKLLAEVPAKRQRKPPKFRLKGTTGSSASLSTEEDERVPLMLTDVQHLLLHSLLDNLNLSEPPRWYVLESCSRINNTTCIVFENASINHWLKNIDNLSCKEIFTDFVEVLTPSAYGGSLVDELALVPLSETDKVELIQKYGSMNLALEVRKDLNVMMKAVFPMRQCANKLNYDDMKDKFPRTQLIMSAWQLIAENYPLPLKGKLKNAYSDYVMTKDVYEPVTPTSPMFGLDCEMCVTNAGSELTRVSIVDEKYDIIYESLVKPYNSIIDYVTRFSGITKSMLENVDKRLEDVQNDIKNVLPPDAILVGQSLNVDLHALKMMHPYVIDTSLIYNFTGERSRKPKLKTLAKEFLQEDIQQGRNGHCPTEDSIASLKLVQLKLCNNIEFGDAVHTNREKYKENLKKVQVSDGYGLSIFKHMIENKKSSIVIGCEDITGDYHSYLSNAKESVHSQLKKSKVKNVKLKTEDNIENVIVTLGSEASIHNFAMGHVKLQIDDENESEKMSELNKWIESVWSKLDISNMLVVVLSGNEKNNGLAMIAIKNKPVSSRI